MGHYASQTQLKQIAQQINTDFSRKTELLDSALADRGYNKTSDLSSSITDAGYSLTFDLKKAYKIGNQVFLTIRVKNGSGSDIASNTNIINLGNDLTPSANLGLFFNVVKGTSASTVVIGSGVIQVKEALANNEYLYINVSYAVS